MATTFLSKTLSASPTDNNKWTFSCWFKRTGFETQTLIYSNDGSTSNVTEVAISDAAKIVFQNKVGGTTTMNLTTNRLFRDVGAFYHVVAVFDSSNATEADRQIIYINGVRETSFATNNPASLNEVSTINSGNVAKIGKGNTSEYFNGLMSYTAFVDGTAYDASYFGETNAATGIWTIKTSPSVTYGNNGFFLKMDTSSPGSDTSGNNNTFTASGTPTLAQDNASNNLVTMNPLDNYRAASTFSNGNNTIVSNASNNTYNTSTIGIASGKFYSEVKVNTNNDNVVGIAGGFSGSSTAKLEDGANNYGYVGYDGTVMNNGSTLATYSTYTTGDIIGIAVDCTNNKFYVSKNGVFQGSADPSNNTGGLSITAAASVINNVYMFAGGENSGARTVTHNWNFGNGFFGVTAVASSNADAAGHGLFEYAVPTGFFTLNTKNLNTYGG